MASTDVPGRRLFGTVRQAIRGAVQADRPPPLDITVALPATWAGRLVDGEGPLGPLPGPAGRALARAVVDAATAHTTALNVPARPVVSVRSSTVAGSVPWLFFAGRRARVPRPELDAVLPAPAPPAAGPDGGDVAELALALATAVRVAIEHDPSVLVGRLQRDRLVTNARDAGIQEPADHVLGAALELVVAHGFAIRDPAALRAALDQHVGLIHTAGELAEVAMDALAKPSIEIRLRESTLRAATLHGMKRHAFVGIRRRLFSDLGVTFPDVAVTLDAGVPEHAAVVRLNDVLGVPRPLPGDAGVAPIVALLEQRLRTHPSWFVSLAETRERIEDLRLALPDLVNAVLERYGEPQLSLFARTFVQEQLPVRNAARLMVLLLDAPSPSTGHDVVRLAEPNRGTGQARRLGARGLVSYTRQQMNEEAARSQPGLTTVGAPRLPADLDATLATIPLGDAGMEAEVGRAERERMIDVVERQLDEGQPGSDQRRSLLTATQHSRSVASRLLAWQYPEIVVLAAEEYPASHRLPPAEPPPAGPAGAPPDGRQVPNRPGSP